MKKFTTFPTLSSKLLTKTKFLLTTNTFNDSKKQLKKYQLLFNQKNPPLYRPNDVTNSQLRPKIIYENLLKYWNQSTLATNVNLTVSAKTPELFYYCCCLICLERLLTLLSQKNEYVYKDLEAQGTMSRFIDLVQTIQTEFNFLIQRQFSAFLYMTLDYFQAKAIEISQSDKLTIFTYLIRNNKANQQILKQYHKTIQRIPSYQDFETTQQVIKRKMKLLQNLVIRIKGFHYLRQTYLEEFKKTSIDNYRAHLQAYLSLLMDNQVLSETISLSFSKQVFLKYLVYEEECFTFYKVEFLKVLKKIFNSKVSCNLFFEDHFLNQVFESINQIYVQADYEQLLPIFQDFQLMVLSYPHSQSKKLQTSIKICHYFGFRSNILFNFYLEKINNLIDDTFQSQYALLIILHNSNKVKFVIENFDYYSTDKEMKAKCQKYFLKIFQTLFEKLSHNSYLYIKDSPHRSYYVISNYSLDHFHKKVVSSTQQTLKQLQRLLKQQSLFFNLQKYNIANTPKRNELLIHKYRLINLISCIVCYIRLSKRHKVNNLKIQFSKLFQNNDTVYQIIKDNIGCPALLKNMVQLLVLYEKSPQNEGKASSNFVNMIRYIDSSRNKFSAYFQSSSVNQNEQLKPNTTQSHHPALYPIIKQNFYISSFKKQKNIPYLPENIKSSIQNDEQIITRLKMNQKQEVMHKLVDAAKNQPQLSNATFKRKYIEYPFMLDYVVKHRNIMYGILFKNSVDSDFQDECATYFGSQGYKIEYISSELQMREFLTKLKNQINKKK